MKAQGIIPWIIVLGSFGAVFYLYSENSKAQTELARLRAQETELTDLRSQIDELKKIQVSESELQRFRKEAAEVYKLRNDVRQLKEDNKQLADETEQLRNRVNSNGDSGALQQAMLELQQLRDENLRLAAGTNNNRSVEQNLAAYKAECINNLRMIDGATEQWALEHKKTQGDIPEYEALMAYLQNPPVCPQGGSYTYPGVGKKPTCNMPEHKLD